MISRMASLSPAVMTLLGCVMTVISASNVCYVDLSGCKYRVTLLTSTCSNELNDQPYPVEKADRNNSIAKADMLPDQLERVEMTLAEDAASLKKLETLEQKLVKMMEDLSVRSLRHVREIRSDLRQMTQSMNQLQTSQQRGPAGGSNGNGRAGLKSLDHPGRPGSPSSVGFQRQCPPEFVGMGSWRSCYRFSNFEASWHDAREYCSAFDANLVSFESMKEAYIVDYLIKSKPEYQTMKGWWTSGTYAVRSQKWMWSVTDQRMQYLKPLEFSRWAPGEPNARSTMHCMIIHKSDKYFWHDATCTDKFAFVCEAEI